MIAMGGFTPPQPEYPVFRKDGDARSEVERVARGLGRDATAIGLHKTIYAERADQTVVLVTDRESPLARELRARGWSEPRDTIDPHAT